MEIRERVSEDVVIAEFLKGEFDSMRFGKRIRDVLEEDGRRMGILVEPDLNDSEENLYRRELLGVTRGFGMNRELFEGFPDDVIWKNAAIPKEELETVNYIDYSYWNELSHGSRLPRDAARNIRNGERVFGVSNDGFFKIVSALEKGTCFARMIFVAKNETSRIVVLEGHARLTAYFLAPRLIPNEMEVIVGFSEQISQWGLY
jgi:hypothetical protein